MPGLGAGCSTTAPKEDLTISLQQATPRPKCPVFNTGEDNQERFRHNFEDKEILRPRTFVYLYFYVCWFLASDYDRPILVT